MPKQMRFEFYFYSMGECKEFMFASFFNANYFNVFSNSLFHTLNQQGQFNVGTSNCIQIELKGAMSISRVVKASPC